MCVSQIAQLSNLVCTPKLRKMKAKEIADAILESMREEVTQFIEQESQISSAIEYEERVLELSRKFAIDLISKSQGQIPKSRNSKKSPDQFRSSGD